MSEDIDLVAAEYVLGTLDAGERTAFAERLRGDAQARLAVTAWEWRLADLNGKIKPVTPPAGLWEGIERGLQAPGAKMHTFKVIDGGGRSASGIGAPRALVASRDRWRAGALVSAGIATALMIYAGNREMKDLAGSRGTYVAAVSRGGDKPALLVRVNLATRMVTVRSLAAETPSGKSLELWYVAGGKPPRSMGIVDQASATLPMPQGADMGATFAVSVEPPGGSRTGGPTGPVVYSGQLIKE